MREGRFQGSHQQGATGDPGSFFAEGYFPTFASEACPPQNAFMTGGPDPPDPWAAYHGSMPHQPGNAHVNDSAWRDWQPSQPTAQSAFPTADGSCPTCGGMYLQDGGSTDTSSDDGSQSQVDGIDPTEAYQEYAFARKKWRRVANKFPRRYRRGFKGSSKGSKSHSYSSFLPPGAFAGGKGKGKSPSKKRNPRDKSGQVMCCNICQSEEHLWRSCPKRQADSAYPSGSIHQPSGQPAQNQLALISTSAGQPLLWGHPATTSLPGVHFFGTEFENLRSVSQAGSVVSSNSNRKRATSDAPELLTPRNPTRPAPSWNAGSPPPQVFATPQPSLSTSPQPGVSASPKTAQSSGKSSVVFGSGHAHVEPLVEGVPQPGVPPPTEPAPGFVEQHDLPSTSVNVPHEHVVHNEEGPSRMLSAEERKEMRDRTVQGLHSIILGLGNQPSGFSQQSPQSSEPGATTGDRPRAVLNLETHLTGQHAMQNVGMNPSQMLTFGSAGFAGSAPSSGNTFVFPSAVPLFPVSSQPRERDADGHSYPWWEVDGMKEEDVSRANSQIYHLRTRRQNGAVGLLIDPGAHDNLIGGRTVEQMCDELQTALVQRSMNKPLPVEGVGKSAQVAEKAACVHMRVQDVLGILTDATYTAPIIQDSLLPPLLGNKTLRKMQVILDCGSGKLIVPGPGGIEVKMSPGSHVYDLELTTSGHWVLPLHPRASSSMSKSHDEELSFNMSCRQSRSQSPPPKRSKSAEAPAAN